MSALLLAALLVSSTPSMASSGLDSVVEPPPVPLSASDAVERITSETPRKGGRQLSATVSTGAAVQGRAELQMDVRVNRKVAMVAHGTLGRTPTVRLTLADGSGTRTYVQDPAQRAGVGMGVKYSFKNFQRGAFVGLDVDMASDSYGELGSATVMRAIPRVGWKTTGERGLTFCVDVGVGARSVEADSPAVAAKIIPVPLAARGGLRLGWSF